MLARFAPAPTGALHLGHVLNAIHVWDVAREHGARVLLRIEDHDRERCRRRDETASSAIWMVSDSCPTSIPLRAIAPGGAKGGRAIVRMCITKLSPYCGRKGSFTPA